MVRNRELCLIGTDLVPLLSAGLNGSLKEELLLLRTK